MERKSPTSAKTAARQVLLVAIGLVVVARRQIVEAGIGGFESNFDLSGGPIELLDDDELGDAAMVGLGFVVVVAKDEDDVVGVLLDRARFAKIRQLRALVFGAPRFDRAVELRKSDHRNAELFGQPLEPSRDFADLLLAARNVLAAAHELQIVDDDEADSPADASVGS